MKYAIALGFFSGLVVAQSATTSAASSSATGLAGLVSQLPTCAVSCLSEAATAVGCSATDVACLCNSEDKLLSTLTPCVLQAGCSADDIATAAKVAPLICSNVQNNPDASAIASASNLIGGALSTAAATASTAASSATATPAAAVRPEMGFGMIGAAILGAAML